ncbi:MAG: peptidase [Prolixibacteraceae bacterium]|nr:MAG: peptidase [Prolixibacteraceae bacterium]
MVRQPLDHADTTRGFFLQRVFVADKGKENAVLLITEGYGANYAASPRYIKELSAMVNSNQITVEHRYFGESWPDSVNWDYLTVINVAADHHAIVEIFKKYYPGKWINTGISKGGQTAVYHRAFYPDDVDVTVAYVAPLNFGVEDGRHEPFLQKVPGTAEQRKKIEEFQIEVLKNREVLVPRMEAFSKEKNYSYPKLKMPRFRSIFAISVYSFFKRYQEQYKAPDNYG